jgi:hypothetical protein
MGVNRQVDSFHLSTSHIPIEKPIGSTFPLQQIARKIGLFRASLKITDQHQQAFDFAGDSYLSGNGK